MKPPIVNQINKFVSYFVETGLFDQSEADEYFWGIYQHYIYIDDNPDEKFEFVKSDNPSLLSALKTALEIKAHVYDFDTLIYLMDKLCENLTQKSPEL